MKQNIFNIFNSKNSSIYSLYIFLLIVGFIFRLELSPYFTFELDLNTFRAWSGALNTHGFGKFYDVIWSDYMPGYMYVLFLLNKIQTAFPDLPYIVLFKLPSTISDLLNALIIFYLLRSYTDIRTAIFTSLVYYFNIALIANSTFWGQIESFHLLPVLLSITLALRGYFSLPIILISISAMIKPQSYVILPFIFLFSVKKDFDETGAGIPYKNLLIKAILTICLVVITVTLITLPFTWEKYSSEGVLTPIIKSLILLMERFLSSYNQYQYTSVNAFNFWALTTGMWVNDQQSFGITYQRWGTVLFALSFLIIIIKYMHSALLKPFRIKQFISPVSNKLGEDKYYLNSILSIVLVFFVLFVFSTRAHERHFFSVVALMSLIVYRSPFYMLSYILVSIIYILNLFYSYLYLYPFGGFTTSTFTPYISSIVILELIVLLSLFVSYIKNKPIIDKSIGRLWIVISVYLKDLISKNKITFEQKSSLKLNFRLKSIESAVLILFIIAFAVKVYGVSEPEKYYFDEIYYAFTANEMAQWKGTGWEYKEGAPEGVAYEWTHPPLGKEITVIGIKIFGNNSLGWRILQVLFGAAGTIIIYFLATELFKNKLAGLFTSILYTFESMIFVLSRISMMDIYLITFMQLALLFVIRFFNYRNFKNIIVAGIFTGCAISVKWNGVFGLFFISVILLIYLSYEQYRIEIPRKIFRYKIYLNPLAIVLLCFISLPLIVYVLTYIPFFIMGNSFGDFLILQKSMYYYHKDLDATHPYSSQWWQWPLMLKPVFIYLKSLGEQSAYIYTMGNPFIWWTGSLFTIAGIILSIIKRNFALLLVVMGLFAFWIPWIISPRSLTFIYHFFPSILFMLLVIGYFLCYLWSRYKYFKYVVCLYLILAIATFIYFYPITAGTPIPNTEIGDYMWIKSWR